MNGSDPFSQPRPPEIPERLLRGTRGADPVFAPEETLYRAINIEDLVGDQISPDSIDSQGHCVNRGKYSLPEDVLLHSDRARCGISVFEVRDIPAAPQPSEDVIYEFKLNHLPESNNFAHSEPRIYKNRTYDQRAKISKLVKMELRTRLSEKIRILRRPAE